jgi:hypothetical protein
LGQIAALLVDRGDVNGVAFDPAIGVNPHAG